MSRAREAMWFRREMNSIFYVDAVAKPVNLTKDDGVSSEIFIYYGHLRKRK